MRFVYWLLVALALAGALACSSWGEPPAEEEFLPPEVTPFPPKLLERLHEIRDLTAQVRDLGIREDIEEGILSPDDWGAFVEQAYADSSEEDKVYIEKLTRAWRLLRMIGPEDDLTEIATEFSSTQIAGLYFPTYKRLALVNAESVDDIGLDQEFTLSHEYTHSFQQHWWEDDRFEELADDDTTEYGATIDCIFEGDASVAAVFYMNKAHGSDWAEDYEEDTLAQAEEGAPEDESIPPAMQRYFAFNYNECVIFVAAVQIVRGWDGVNELYDQPPSTTEQILHPEKYFFDEGPARLESVDLQPGLDEGWEAVESGVFGEFDLYNYLYTIGGDEELASEAAAGWGAGWLSLYADGVEGEQGALLHMALVWDSPDDFFEFRDAYNQSLSALGVEPVLDKTATSWQDGDERGVALWGDDGQVDIVIANDSPAFDGAVGQLRGVASAAP